MPLHDRAIENDPLNATAWFWRGLKFVTLGYLEKGRSDIEKCIELDPNYFNCPRHLARIYTALGDFETALDYYLISLEGGLRGTDFWLIHSLMINGNRIAAAIALKWESNGDPDYPIREFLAAMDNPGGTDSVGIEKFERWVLKQSRSPSLYDIEWITLGAYDRIKYIQNSTRLWLDAFAVFRASPYFKPYVEEMGLPPYWREHGFPPMCRPIGEDDFECD